MSYKDLLKQIREMQEQIALHGKLNAEVLKKVDYKFRLDWNYHSNAIEGNSLTREETRTVMINNITVDQKPLRDVLEMRGHDEVVQSIIRVGKAELNLSEKRIREIHRAIIHEEDSEKKDKPGNWKTEVNYLYNYRGERFDFLDPAEVPGEMHTLLNWLNAEAAKTRSGNTPSQEPAMLAFEFHLRYLSIHPFYDGNGRTARLFMNLILISFGLPPVIIRKEDKDVYNRYLADIQAYGGEKDLYYSFMAEQLIRSLQIVLDAIAGKEIEEPDDLDKKVALLEWDMKMLGKSPVKSAEAMEFAWKTGGLKEFFKSYFDKVKTFEKLFESSKISIQAGRDLIGFDLDAVDAWFDGKKITDSLNKLEVSYYLNGMNKLRVNYSEHFDVVFEGTAYRLKIIFQNLAEKKYSETLTKEEIKTLVDERVNQLYNWIKTELDKAK